MSTKKTAKETVQRRKAMRAKHQPQLESMSWICSVTILLISLVLLFIQDSREWGIILLLSAGLLLNITRCLCNYLKGRILQMVLNVLMNVSIIALLIWHILTW